MRWLIMGLLSVVLITAGVVGHLARQFNDQNFVADKSLPDYQSRIIPLWPEGGIPDHMDAAHSPNSLPFYLRFWKQDDFELKPYMLHYPADGPGPHPAVLVFPGGGYLFRSEKHEGIKMAKWLNGLGISAFVVNYRLIPYTHPVPLKDALQAVRLVRQHAADWQIDPTRVGIMGFSAGGHLSGMVSTHGTGDSRPDFAILGYGVLAPKEFDMGNIGGRMDIPVEEISPRLHVTASTPPSFIWHTKEDPIVPWGNSQVYYDTLIAAGVPAELVLFETGTHGLGLAEDHEEARVWPGLAEQWLKRQGIIGKIH